MSNTISDADELNCNLTEEELRALLEDLPDILRALENREEEKSQ